MTANKVCFVSSGVLQAHMPESAKKKALQMLNPGSGITSLAFSEFGTRRRRSFHSQDLVLRGLIEGYEEWKAAGGTGGALSGTSNVSLVDVCQSLI